MKIHYIIGDDGNKLFSFSQHDFQMNGTAFIDGGFDYIRTNREIQYAEISDIIEDIRKQFKWISLYDINKNRRKVPVRYVLYELNTEHILNIIEHLIDRLIYTYEIATELNNKCIYERIKPALAMIDIFNSEIQYLKQNDIL